MPTYSAHDSSELRLVARVLLLEIILDSSTAAEASPIHGVVKKAMLLPNKIPIAGVV